MEDKQVAWGPSYGELIVIVRNRSPCRVPTIAKRFTLPVYSTITGWFLPQIPSPLLASQTP